MGFDTLLFAAVCIPIVFEDAKKFVISDMVMLPAIIAMIGVKYYMGVSLPTLFAYASFVFLLFAALLFFVEAFGGGDLRFGVFCALYLASEDILWFFVIAGVVHLLLLSVLHRKFWAFAPAMSIAALSAHGFSDQLWGFLR